MCARCCKGSFKGDKSDFKHDGSYLRQTERVSSAARLTARLSDEGLNQERFLGAGLFAGKVLTGGTVHAKADVSNHDLSQKIAPCR